MTVAPDAVFQRHLATLLEDMRESNFGGDESFAIEALRELAVWTVCLWLCSGGTRFAHRGVVERDLRTGHPPPRA